jgi:hypothetical protein
MLPLGPFLVCSRVKSLTRCLPLRSFRRPLPEPDGSGFRASGSPVITSVMLRRARVDVFIAATAHPSTQPRHIPQQGTQS